jgi:hypothetical protein
MRLNRSIIILFISILYLTFLLSLNSHAQTFSYAYIDCVSHGSTIGIKLKVQPRSTRTPKTAVGARFGGNKALYVRGDGKSIVRIGFIDTNGMRIPDRFVKAGPNSTDAYYTFPCPRGDTSTCVQRIQAGQISHIQGSKITSFVGCSAIADP